MCICENVAWNVIKKKKNSNSVCWFLYLFFFCFVCLFGFRSFRTHNSHIANEQAKESKLFARRINMRVGVNSILTCAHILNNTFFFHCCCCCWCCSYCHSSSPYLGCCCLCTTDEFRLLDSAQKASCSFARSFNRLTNATQNKDSWNLYWGRFRNKI